MNALISMIIPVYNVEEYLPACLESVLNQTYKKLEIILVDDGAKDRSGEICEEYKLRDSRIQVIHKKNGGLSDARNKGMEYATGEYLVFLDSDDVIAGNYVEYLYSLVCDTNADIGICDPVHCYPGGEIVFEKETLRRIYDSEDAICEMLYQKSFLVAAWGKIYRRNVFADIRFPYGMLFEDSAIMYRVFDRAGKIVYGNAKLYGYMHRENSITTKKFSIRDCDILAICSQIVDYMKDRSPKLQKAADSYQVVGALRVYLNAPVGLEFDEQINECKKIIGQKGKKVLMDSNARKKTRIAVFMYLFARPVMPVVHKKIDRWK